MKHKYKDMSKNTGQENDLDKETFCSNEETNKPTLNELDENVSKEETKKEKKDRFTEKINELKEQIEKITQESEQWKTKYYEAYANLDNTRKQIEKDNAEFRKYMAIQIISELIPCLDALEATTRFNPTDPQVKSFLTGVKMVFSMFMSRLEDLNFKTLLPNEGDTFDPKTMNATETEVGENPNKVVHVHNRCYLYKDRLVRPSNVTVSKLADKDKNENEAENKEVTDTSTNEKGE